MGFALNFLKNKKIFPFFHFLASSMTKSPSLSCSQLGSEIYVSRVKYRTSPQMPSQNLQNMLNSHPNLALNCYIKALTICPEGNEARRWAIYKRMGDLHLKMKNYKVS